MTFETDSRDEIRDQELAQKRLGADAASGKDCTAFTEVIFRIPPDLAKALRVVRLHMKSWGELNPFWRKFAAAIDEAAARGEL